MVYREIVMELEGGTVEGERAVYTVSVDEKPGVQALSTSAPDLPPVPGRHAAVSRDQHYVRHGTVSILAGVDLHDGHIIARVHDRHCSREFVEPLKEMDAYSPSESVIRGDHGVLGESSGEIRLRTHTHARIMVESDRGGILEDEPNVPAAHTGELEGRAGATDHAGY